MTEVLNIKCQPLKKTFHALRTAKNFEATLNFQLEAAKAEQADSDNPVEMLTMARDQIASVQKFLKTVLNLKDAQLDEFMTKLSPDEMIDFAGRVGLRLQGLSDKEIDEANDSDPKAD